MPTNKRRINITVDDETYSVLEKLSKKTRKSVSHVGLSLIEKSLKLREDFYFSRQADERLDKGEKRISHEDAWEI